VNFFRQKVLLWPKNIFYLVGLAQLIASSPLNYDCKVRFLPFSAFSACCVQHCGHSRASASMQLASLSLLTPFMRVVQLGSPYGVLEGRYKNTCRNYGKIRSYAASNTFYPSKKMSSSLLNTPISLIWLEGHFRRIYCEEIMKIEPVLIHWSQFWCISMALWWSTLVSRVFIEDMHLVDSPPHHRTINSTQNHQFRVPSSGEINFFFL